MTDPIKVGLPFDQLGLPPMELAESNERRSRFLYKCLYPTLQKTFILIFIITFCVGAYVLLLNLLETNDNSRTEIIIVTGLKDTPNITLHQNDMNIVFHFKNASANARIRRKRNIGHINEKHVNLEEFKKEDLQKVKDIILQHQTLCHEKEHEQVCQELIMKLKSIIHQNEVAPPRNIEVFPNKGNKRNVQVHIDGIMPVSIDNHKHEAQSNLHKLKGFVDNKLVPVIPSDMHPTNLMPHAHIGVPPPITDTCLLAKLLKQNYPHVQGIYDSANQEFLNPHSDPSSSYMRYFQPPTHSYTQSREIEPPKQTLHQQDIDIFMSFLSDKSKISQEHKSEVNSTIRDVECPSGARPCGNSDDCLDEKQWCDGTVDCADASDEVQCSCKSRVDSSRLCDGYFDCPFGEDEMGCFGCSDDMFSCGDINLQFGSSCFTKEQRCNIEVDCPNHKDEIECNMLAPSFHKKPLFAISNTEGYLHRNFKGDWYAVCQNPYMWAHDACRRETGLIIRPPVIQIVPIDPLLKVNYLNTGPGGSIQSSDTCFNASAVYVTCPDFLCGTRVSTALLRQNIAVENHLFGRNKRFLYPGHPYDPYHIMYYGNRMKREASSSNIEEIVKIDSDNSDVKIKDERNKRAESRVVGGRPSQPAAWPWMVAVHRNGMFHCGGVIFTQSWIISAAHCVHKFWDHYYEVQVGMLRRFSFSPQEKNHRVTHVIVNQHYSQVDMKDDLSLLKVEPAIQFSRWVRPICLPGPNTAGTDWVWGPPPGTKCTAVGWGATIEHGPDPDHMREVEVPIWENCKHIEDKAGREICAGLVEGGKDACQGDSGGPLLCRNPLNSQQWYLAGIVSHGDGCARKGEPGVYTRVSLYVKWIKYHTSSKSLPLVQPIQECPGFKCKSGISKCLPDSRKCDRIVDCLDAEDEINCAYADMRSVNNSLLTEPEKIKDENKSTEKRASVINTVSSIEKTQNTPIDVTTITTSEPAVTEFFVTLTVTDTSTTEKGDYDNQPMESIEDTKLPDFEHASTLEISTSSSSEESESRSTESITVDPVDNTSRGDVEPFSVTFKTDVLESRSSILEGKRTENEKDRETDIIDDWSEFSTTVIQTFDSDTQSSQIKESTEIPATTLSNSNSQENIITTEASKTDKPETKSQDFVPELLPNHDMLSEVDENTTTIGDNNKTDQSHLESSADSVSGKSLPNLESKNDILSKIEDIVSSELQPANIRRKNRIPKQFECRRIFQIIPHTQRCDHKADCEDGTDELGCTCTDYLSTYDENLLCDGFFDCADGQDEVDCYSCPDQHFLCKRSEICLPKKYVCDGKAQCPLGEDELNCFALSNGKEMIYDIDDKPRINLEGYLTKRNKDDWQIMCEENLSVDQQEQSATHICHYLGFSAANRYLVKYINVKEEDIVRSKMAADKRSRRSFDESKPINFAYRSHQENNETARNIVITEPQLLKEECVPNVTITCKSLYVYCDRSLYTDFDGSQNLIFNRAAEETRDVTTHKWPWIAKVFVEGSYKCTGILVDASWVLISDACLWDASLASKYVTVILGSPKTLDLVGAFEEAHEVDAKKDLYRSRVVLLHLKVPAEYSNQVKPMVVSSPFQTDEKTICVSVGQDNRNTSVSVYLDESTKNCKLINRCFTRRGTKNICSIGAKSERQWAGLISCHNEQGWFPVASFVDSRGECGIGDTIVATEIENLRHEIRYYSGKPISYESLNNTYDDCEGVRCSRGRCVSVQKMCDGIQDCEDANDESDESCRMKRDICDHDPYHRGCDCTFGQMKCRNGKCISKELFRDGSDDCGDGTDEPARTRCSDYLARAMPSRLCDGILHCLDRSDEDPMYCKCFAKRSVKCGSSNSETEHCVAPDMVCDGVRDCPNGEDERTCIGLSAPKGALYGVGQVMVQSHGVWRSKCYPTQEHTKFELEAICRELGFLSGHAKEIKEMKNIVDAPNNIALDPFSEVILNNQTVIKMRNTNEPIAKAVFDADLEKCYPVFIECI